MFISFTAHITGAYGLLSCGKILLSESFGNLDMVTPAFATTFVAGLSGANLFGRLFFTQLSDQMAVKSGTDPFFARKNIFYLIFGLTLPSYLGIVWSIQSDINSILPLAVFCTSSGIILSAFGGAAATRPAIIGDLYGLKNVGMFYSSC